MTEKEEFSIKVAKLISRYAKKHDSPIRIVKNCNSDFLCFTHNYGIAELLWDNGLRFAKEKQNGKD